MTENKISVKEYLDNKDLLSLIYVPYDQKVNICDVILSQVLNKDGFATVDSVLLERVKTQIIIESISNLDLSIVDESGLNGYDLLSLNNELEVFIGHIEFGKFNQIIDLRLKDFYNENASLRGYIHYLANKVNDKIVILKNDFSEFIQNLDSKAIANQISDVVSDSMKKSRKNNENIEERVI